MKALRKTVGDGMLFGHAVPAGLKQNPVPDGHGAGNMGEGVLDGEKSVRRS